MRGAFDVPVSPEATSPRAPLPQLQRPSNRTPVESPYAHIVVHRIEHPGGEALRRALVQPHAIGVAHGLPGERTDMFQRYPIPHVEQAAVLELIGGDPVAAA